jgi:hypothetical protein
MACSYTSASPLPAWACHGLTFTFTMMVSDGFCVCTVGINEGYLLWCVCVYIHAVVNFLRCIQHAF